MRWLGVLGGESPSDLSLRRWAAHCDQVIAVDGGYRHLQAINLIPNAVIGDFDSIEELPENGGFDIIHELDQNHSDVEKLFRYGESCGVKEFVLIGGHGGRVDHLLASHFAAVAAAGRVRWVYPSEHVVLIRPGKTWEAMIGASLRVSMLPLGGPVQAWLSGVQWPLKGETLEVGRFWSLSNRSVEPQIRVRAEGGHALLFIEHDPEVIPEW